MAISIAKPQSRRHFLVRLCDRINVPDWLVWAGIIANFMFVLFLNDPILNSATATITASFLVAMGLRSLFTKVQFGRRQLRTLRAIGVTISCSATLPFAAMAQSTQGNGCQNTGFLSAVSNYAYGALSATPFLASWICDQVAVIVVMALIALSMCVIWVCVDSLMTQQPLTVYLKPMLSIMLSISIIAGLAALLTYTGGGTAPVGP